MPNRRVAIVAAIASAMTLTLAAGSVASGLTRTQREFVAAAPFIVPPIGPALSGHFPPCKPADLRSVAQTRATPDGVIGVVHLRHRKHHRCSLHVRRSPTALLGAAGHNIGVPVTGAAAADRGGTTRPDIALHSGNAIWGLAWRGSWCGPKARFVRMQLRSGARVKAPIVGPQPGCDGRSHSVLLRGLVGGVGSPVQTAPPEWSGLSSNISPSGHTNGQFLTGAVFNLINNTSHPIPLDPCPAYTIAVSSHQNVGPATAISGGILPGCTGSQAIPSGQALRFTLDNLQYAFVNNRATSGSSLTVTVVIAGLPAATTQVPVP